jgi:diguanylate cyclase (GGDEF)-like protein
VYRFLSKLHRFVQSAPRTGTALSDRADNPNTTCGAGLPDAAVGPVQAELQERLKQQHELTAAQDERLRVRNLQFDMTINNMSLGLCFFDGSQRLILCNNRYTEMYDLDPARVVPGTSLQEIVDLRFAAGSFPQMSKTEYLVWRDQIAVSDKPTDSVVKLKNGRTIQIRHRPMPDLGWVATHEDITEREVALETSRRVLHELEEQNQRFDAALNNMPHGLSMFDAERRLIVCNRRFAEMYRLPQDLTEQGTPFDRITAYRSSTGQAPADVEAYSHQMRKIGAAGKPHNYRVALVDGRTIQVDYEPMISGGWVVTHQDVTEAIRAEARISHLALHDALTDLPNRVLFQEKLAEALLRVPRGDNVAVLCLDLDRFKAVNDTLGHAIGDELLKAAADRLRGCVRDNDTVARLGGDEFAIIQPFGEQPTGATSLASRIIDSLSAPYTIAGHEIVIGTSIGVSIAPNDGMTADLLLKNADLALYRAKSDGRGVFRFFEPAMDAKMRARREMELELRAALVNGEFEVFYQPLVNVTIGQVAGFEALLRWRSPGRGLVSPNDFIPLAEEIGLIVPIGAWVLKQACMEAAKWPNQIKIAVNLSPVQFKSDKLVFDVIAALAASGLSPLRLELEITETVMLQETETTLEMLRQIKALGVAISMDDFGTGYSSLSYLRKFPFDKIKIDQSFIRELSDAHESVAIVRAVMGLGTSLGMVTMAEGVETVEQLRTLQAEGCAEAQGFLFSPAVPAGEITELLERIHRDLAAA